MLDPAKVVIPDRFRNHPLFTAPVCGTNFGFLAENGWYLREESLRAPAEMEKLGVNWTTINMSFCQEAFYSRRVFLDFTYSTGEWECAEMVKRLHDHGVHVLFKPCLTPLDSSWMGAVKFPEGHQIEAVQVSYWDQWFDSFKKAMVYFANFAQRAGMDALLIGAEYFGTEGREKEWREVIELVRERYDGPISYEFTCDSRKAYPLCWFEPLDFLAYSYYPPASAANGILDGFRTGSPDDPPSKRLAMPRELPHQSLQDMEEYLRPRQKRIASISETYYNKPIVFTEFGTRSSHGSIMLPYNYTWDAPYDGQEQADYMQAGINTFSPLSCWMGFFWWKWDETQKRPQYHGDPAGDRGFTIQGKPAEEVFKNWARTCKVHI